MNSNRNHPTGAIALCAAAYAGSRRVATCATLLPVGDAAPEWVQLLPPGIFKPGDAREAWKLSDPQGVIGASQPNLPTANIDYDHGTDTGGPSRAAGWIKELRNGGPNGEPGIWARVEWNEEGARAVASKEYRFISPVFVFDEKTREVKAILRAALTNNPALRQLKALASIEPTQPENQVNEELKKIAAALGLDPETATIDDVLAAIAALNENATAMAAKKKGLCAVLKAAGLGEDIAKFDDAATVAICAKLKTTGSDDGNTVATLRKEVSDLRVELLSIKGAEETRSAEQKVADAITAGKLTPAQKDDALALCKSDPARFEAFIGKATAFKAGRIAPVGDGGKTDGAAGLDEDQLAMCSKLGIKPEDFKATATAMGIKE